MLLRIFHETKLTYTAPVTETVFEVRMAPPSDDDQTSLRYRLVTKPRAPVTSYRDGFGNRVDLFNVATPYQELVVQVTSYVRTHRRPASGRLAGVAWPAVGPIAIEALEFLTPSPLVDRSAALDALVAELPRPSGTLADALWRILRVVAERLRYEKKATTARTSPTSSAASAAPRGCRPGTSAATSTTPARSPPTPGARSGRETSRDGSTSTRPRASSSATTTS